MTGCAMRTGSVREMSRRVRSEVVEDRSASGIKFRSKALVQSPAKRHSTQTQLIPPAEVRSASNSKSGSPTILLRNRAL